MYGHNYLHMAAIALLAPSYVLSSPVPSIHSLELTGQSDRMFSKQQQQQQQPPPKHNLAEYYKTLGPKTQHTKHNIFKKYLSEPQSYKF